MKIVCECGEEIKMEHLELEEEKGITVYVSSDGFAVYCNSCKKRFSYHV